ELPHALARGVPQAAHGSVLLRVARPRVHHRPSCRHEVLRSCGASLAEFLRVGASSPEANTRPDVCHPATISSGFSQAPTRYVVRARVTIDSMLPAPNESIGKRNLQRISSALFVYVGFAYLFVGRKAAVA